MSCSHHRAHFSIRIGAHVLFSDFCIIFGEEKKEEESRVTKILSGILIELLTVKKIVVSKKGAKYERFD